MEKVLQVLRQLLTPVHQLIRSLSFLGNFCVTAQCFQGWQGISKGSDWGNELLVHRQAWRASRELLLQIAFKTETSGWVCTQL